MYVWPIFEKWYILIISCKFKFIQNVPWWISPMHIIICNIKYNLFQFTNFNISLIEKYIILWINSHSYCIWIVEGNFAGLRSVAVTIVLLWALIHVLTDGLKIVYAWQQNARTPEKLKNTIFKTTALQMKNTKQWQIHVVSTMMTCNLSHHT